MRTPRSPHGPRLPRRTARLRLTVLYGSAFLACGACGAAVLAFTSLLYGHLAPPQVHSVRTQQLAGAPSPSPSPRQVCRSAWRVSGRLTWTGSSC